MNDEPINAAGHEIHAILDDLDGIKLPPHILELCEQLRRSADEILTLTEDIEPEF